MADPYTVAPQIQENILRTVLAIASQQEAERERAANAPNLAAQADYYKALTSNTLANALKQELINRLTQGGINAMGVPPDTGIGLPPLPAGGGVLLNAPPAPGARIPNEQITQLLMGGALNPNDLLTMAGLQGQLPDMGKAAEIGLGMQPRAGEALNAQVAQRGQDVASQDNLSRFIGSVYSAFGKIPTAEWSPSADDVKNTGSYIAAVLGKLVGTGATTLEARALGPAQTVALINAYANFIGAEAQQLAAKASSMRGTGKDDSLEQAVRLFGSISTNMQALAGRASAAANVGDEDTARNATAAMFGLAKQANSVATALGLPTALPEVASPKPAGFLERLFGGGSSTTGFDTSTLTPEQRAAILSGQMPTDLSNVPTPGGKNGKPAPTGLPLPSTPPVEFPVEQMDVDLTPLAIDAEAGEKRRKEAAAAAITRRLDEEKKLIPRRDSLLSRFRTLIKSKSLRITEKDIDALLALPVADQVQRLETALSAQERVLGR